MASGRESLKPPNLVVSDGDFHLPLARYLGRLYKHEIIYLVTMGDVVEESVIVFAFVSLKCSIIF
tara:strand:+ start:351 stop:545 length:195 start_codon:yes stop_codon:yes gene_type:complete